MITNTKQSWEVGSTVKVGFLTLVVRAVAGAEYLLSNKDGTRLYAFEPHNGCRGVGITEARDMLAAAQAQAARIAAQAIAKASAARAVDQLFAAV